MSWRGRTYVAAWMTGQACREVRVRYMPHHDHEIDICDASGKYLGPAHLADAATPNNSMPCAQPVRSVPGVCAPR